MNRDLFRQTLNEQRNHPQQHSLIKQIEQWEVDSIQTIRRTAKECKEKLFQHADEHLQQVEMNLNKLTNELRETREENDFNEMDLIQLKRKLRELEEQLNQIANMSIEEDSTPFISKISVVTGGASDSYSPFQLEREIPPGASGISKKASKNPAAPKRPLSVFFLFTRYMIGYQEGESSLSVGDITKEIGAQWRKARDDVKKHYEQKASVEKQKYDQLLAEYKKSVRDSTARKEATWKSKSSTKDSDDDEDDD